MSNEALNWAMPIQLEKSSWKFVLVCMANRVRSEALCFQSVAQLVEDTCLDRKTVLTAIAKLCEAGLIADTGERIGSTKQIVVYKLAVGNSPKNGSVSSKAERAMVDDYLDKSSPENGTVKGTENGTLRPNQTVPFLDGNSTVFSGNSTVFSGNSPKNGTRKRIKPSKPPDTNKNARIDPPEFELIKSIYPKRLGDQGWREALGHCNTHLREGSDWDQMADGARRYAAHCDALNQTGTQYVKQAKTFFGKDKFFLQEWALPRTRGQQRQDRNISASLQWLAEQEANDASH